MARLVQTLHILDAPFAALGLAPSMTFHAAILCSAVVVLVYIFLGGLRGAIYNEVLQFFLIVAGFAPLVYLGLRRVGGWEGLKASLPGDYAHVWRGMGHAAANRLGVDVFALISGLGFVLSFGYWCSDFLVVQRAMAADSMASARQTPLIAAMAKVFFPALVIVPGLIAMSLSAPRPQPLPGEPPAPAAALASASVIPVKVDPATGRIARDAAGVPERDYDLAVPNLLERFYPTGLLGLGLTALLASFMSGMAGNVTAFNTVFTYDLYQAHVRPHASDAHYLHVGRVATFAGVLASVGAAYVTSQFNNIMDLIQLICAFVNAPVFATFLLGMFWRRANGDGAFVGLLAGILAAALHHGLTLPAGSSPGIKGAWIAALHHYPSEMAQNFWTAIIAWSVCFLVTILVSLAGRPPGPERLEGLAYGATAKVAEAQSPWWSRPAVLGAGVLGVTLGLNLIFW
jgi:SSS family solute:Na+ symporter